MITLFQIIESNPIESIYFFKVSMNSFCIYRYPFDKIPSRKNLVTVFKNKGESDEFSPISSEHKRWLYCVQRPSWPFPSSSRLANGPFSGCKIELIERRDGTAVRCSQGLLFRPLFHTSSMHLQSYPIPVPCHLMQSWGFPSF